MIGFVIGSYIFVTTIVFFFNFVDIGQAVELSVRYAIFWPIYAIYWIIRNAYWAILGK